jgi:mannosyltransferase OCH1-like enzyme
LGYFGKFLENNTRNVKFYHGIANLEIDPSKTIHVFEELLRDKDLENEKRLFIEKKLLALYKKNKLHIPKVIHLIYFKERELCAYHLRCIESIIKHMPDYKIIIHNDVEPIENEYWLKMKEYAQIEISNRNRPREFDGFDLYFVQYQADVTRLEVLYEYGGIYLDLDILVIKNFEDIFNSNDDFYICKEGKGEDSGLINSFLAATPKNEFLKIWHDNFRTGLRMDNWAYHIRETNKTLIKDNPHYKIKYGINILDHEYFFPFPWHDRDAFENKREIVFDAKTYGIHLFDTILHDLLMKNEFFPAA